MDARKRNLIDFLSNIEVLSFGEYTLGNGRVSPYYFNTGKADTALKISRLAREYAVLIDEDIDAIFGPAYKGTFLSPVVAIEFSKLHGGRDVGYLSNRKEKKTHGDVGELVGEEIKDGYKISMIDDVITSGETKYESVDLLRRIAKVDIKELIIAFNRQEVDAEGNDAVLGFSMTTGINVKSILCAMDLRDYLLENAMEKQVRQMDNYLREHGTRQVKGMISAQERN